MADNKKSFLLYCDIIHTVKKLPKDKAGELFIHILEYVNDLAPVANDTIIELVFEPIKQSLKRDLIKYQNICERNAANGSKGGRPKNPDEPKKPTGLSGNPKNPDEPKKADSDIDSDIDIKKKINIPAFEEFKKYALENQPLINIESLKLKYDSWVVNNWKNGNGKKILNWKSTLLNTIPYIKLNAAIKEAPKFEYLPREWKIENGYQVSRQYIKANNKDGFKALMTDEEKVKKGFDVNLIVTNNGEIL